MEHVEVLRDLSEVCRAAIKAGDWKVDGACDPDAVLRRADAAIASLSAPQPPAEAQGDGEASEGWHAALDSASELVSNAPDARYRKRAEQVRDWIKAHPAAPPSAPVGVEGEAKARLFCLAEEEISSGTLDDLIDEAIDSDIVEPGDTLRVEEWVRVREFEVGPDDDERLAAQQGGSDNDR